MSAGNLKDYGGKGNNFPFQFNLLQLIGAVSASTNQLQPLLQDIDNNTDGIEPLLTQILASLQAGKDYEVFFVRDGNDEAWLEVRTLDETSGAWTIEYFAPGDLTPHQLDDPGGPLSPVIYESSFSILSNILSSLTQIINNQVGLVATGIQNITLPYSIPGNVYNSFTIITSGSVSIDSVTVPPGTYTYSCGSNEKLTGKALADVSGGSVILLTTAK